MIPFSEWGRRLTPAALFSFQSAMSKACMHVARDIRGKLTCRAGRIHNKQVCRVCGWVREYSLPTDVKGALQYGEWTPPPGSGKTDSAPDGDQVKQLRLWFS